jgi:hypothetical protein
VRHPTSLANGSPKVIDDTLHDDIAELSSRLHTFGWEVFKARVTKHRNKLESIRKLVEEHPDSFSITQNEALHSFFRHLDQILFSIDQLETFNTVPQTFTDLLHYIYIDWVAKNLITEDDSWSELLTVLGQLDVLVTGAHPPERTISLS